MKENLILFETAKLAKEKGFNIDVLHFYCKNNTCDYLKEPYKYSFEVNANQERKINDEINNFGYGLTWSAPTQSLLQKWLRDIHNIHANANVNFYNKKEKLGFYYSIDRFDENNIHDGIDYDMNQIELIGDKKGFDSYEDALETALQIALKLIK